MHYFHAHVYVHTSAWEIVCEKCWGSLNVRLCPPNHATLSAQSCDSPPKLWTLGECWPLCSPPVVNCLYHLEECRGEQRFFTPRWQLRFWRSSSPLEANFTPGQSSPLGARIKIGFRINKTVCRNQSLGRHLLSSFAKEEIRVENSDGVKNVRQQRQERKVCERESDSQS
jgi:hypothetical protein